MYVVEMLYLINILWL